MIDTMTVYSCPICASPLSKEGRVFSCPTGHTFDIAKEGYVNLLPANKKRSLAPGDNADMVSARSRFLKTGAYQTLAHTLVSLLGQSRRLVDLGCGEGYFTAELCGSAREVYGLDISKVAIRAACKRATGANFVVASTMRLPFLSESFDTATVIMAPMSDDVPRILKQGSLLCRVSPGERHLVELRELAYREVRPVKQPSMTVDGFTSVGDKQACFETLLGSDSLVDLIAMTPMQFRTSKEFREQVSQIEQLKVTADFRIDLFRKD